MADDDPFGILLSPPGDPNPYPHIRGDDRYFKTCDPFGMPVLNTSLPAAAQPSGWERRRADYHRYMDRGGLFGTAWGMFPPDVRKSWATIPTLWAENTPGAGIRDMVESSGVLTRAVMNVDPLGALGGLGGMALGAIGSIPGMRGVTKPVSEATKLAEALTAAEKAGLSMSAADRLQRMADQGYTRGMWRGGGGVADGPWYTPNPDAAREFAARHGPRADVREYAIRFEKPFDFGVVFGPGDFLKAAEKIAAYNPAAAKEFRQMTANREGISGGDFYMMLKRQSNGADRLLKELGYDALQMGKEIRMLDMSHVRDANKAAFNPAMRDSRNPFAALLPAAAGAGLFGYSIGRSDDDAP